MNTSNALRGVLRIVLLFLSLVGSAGWSIYWVLFRDPPEDIRVLAVGLLLAVVLGWWPWVSLGGAVLVSALALIFGPSELKGQLAGEAWVFGLLGLGWGTLARLQFHAAPARPGPAPVPAPRPSASGSYTPPRRSPDPEAFRSRRLMEGADDVSRRAEVEPFAPVHPQPAPTTLGWTPPIVPVASEGPGSAHSSHNESEFAGAALPGIFHSPSSAAPPPPEPPPRYLPVPPPVAPFAAPELPGVVQDRPRGLLPRPPAGPPSLQDYGGESIYVGSLPGGSIPPPDSSHPSGFPAAPLLASPLPEEPSVVPAMEFPTMELPVNTLLRPQPSQSGWSPPSSGGAGSAGPASSSGEAGSDSQGVRRSAAFQRPETEPGSPWEKILEWYNQFSWAPWSAAELEKKYHRPGVKVGWETLALQDVAATWNHWRQGCAPRSLVPGQIELHSLQGFLRCEMLGVLRHQGFPDLHLLSRTETDSWTAVYAEVRSRMRGGEARIHRVDSGDPLVDPETGLVGRPDRLAEIRGEHDVVALVTPFSTQEGLSWSGVYAMAQYRLAQGLGVLLSGVPVVVNLTLPVWDERKQCRVMTVDDMASEKRRLDVALERFRRILEGQVPPRPQQQVSTCDGCGWRHFCPNYQGHRPRLDLSSPPPQVAAALR